MTPAHVLLSHRIDYAGLFPPASLDLQRTVENYGFYRTGPSAWALGRIILPSNGIVAFAEQWPTLAGEWPVALLVRGDFDELRSALSAGANVEMIESRPLPLDQIDGLARLVPAAASLFIEVDASIDPEASILAIAAVGARAKLRTGGTVAAAIPSTDEVARFLSCCVKHHIAFKATAGLHHAFRGIHPLTYEPGSERAYMHGFLNVLLATALLADGGDPVAASALLEESSVESFHFSEQHVRWRDWTVSAQQLAQSCRETMMSFGSCSFAEPLGQMKAAGLIG